MNSAGSFERARRSQVIGWKNSSACHARRFSALACLSRNSRLKLDLWPSVQSMVSLSPPPSSSSENSDTPPGRGRMSSGTSEVRCSFWNVVGWMDVLDWHESRSQMYGNVVGVGMPVVEVVVLVVVLRSMVRDPDASSSANEVHRRLCSCSIHGLPRSLYGRARWRRELERVVSMDGRRGARR